MNKYLLIYHSPAEAMERYASMTDEETQEVMAAWTQWKESHGDAVVDFGNPVGQRHIVSGESSRQEADDVGGYSIIQAEGLEAAHKVLENHPTLADNDGSTISLYQIYEM